VLMFDRTIFAAGTTAPVASVTVPRILPVFACAKTQDTQTKAITIVRIWPKAPWRPIIYQIRRRAVKMQADEMLFIRICSVSAGIAFAAGADDFVGAVECGKCHPAQYEKQRRSHHASSLTPILKSALPEKLIGHTVREKSGLEFEYGPAPGGISVFARRGGKQ